MLGILDNLKYKNEWPKQKQKQNKNIQFKSISNNQILSSYNVYCLFSYKCWFNLMEKHASYWNHVKNIMRFLSNEMNFSNQLLVVVVIYAQFYIILHKVSSQRLCKVCVNGYLGISLIISFLIKFTIFPTSFYSLFGWRICFNFLNNLVVYL